MTLAPLLSAPLPIRIHAIAAITAFVLGIVQFSAPKGTLPHRSLGWFWVGLMTAVALSSFWIHTLCTVGGFSVIHLLSIFTLIVLPIAVLNARTHRVRNHRRAMMALFLGALLVAGIFTFMPGRIMHDIAFGTRDATSTCPIG